MGETNQFIHVIESVNFCECDNTHRRLVDCIFDRHQIESVEDYLRHIRFEFNIPNFPSSWVSSDVKIGWDIMSDYSKVATKIREHTLELFEEEMNETYGWDDDTYYTEEEEEIIEEYWGD